MISTSRFTHSLVLSALIAIAGAAPAQTRPTLEKEFINPAAGMGFTNVVTVKTGNVKTIHISGQVGRGEDMQSQAITAFESLRTQLEAAGATPADVVKITTYIVDYSQEELAAYREGKNRVFGGLQNQPASTLLGVQALARPQFRIEVEATAVVSEEDGAKIEPEFINPDTLSNTSRSYSQAVAVMNAGVKTIYVAGQVAIDANGTYIGANDLGAQARQAFGNLSRALEAAGAGTEDVVKVNVFVVGYDREKTREISRAMNGEFSPENRPASTWVWVESLARPHFLLEVEAIAVVGG